MIVDNDPQGFNALENVRCFAEPDGQVMWFLVRPNGGGSPMLVRAKVQDDGTLDLDANGSHGHRTLISALQETEAGNAAILRGRMTPEERAEARKQLAGADTQPG